jgi:carbon storage regulator
MLVLSRRVGERLMIGDDVVVTVIEVRSDGVRLGIEAPREIRVHRAEVLEAVRRSNVEAVEADESTEAALRLLVPPTEPQPAAGRGHADRPADAGPAAPGPKPGAVARPGPPPGAGERPTAG